MSFFLILTVALMAWAAVVVVKRRSQRGSSRSGRYRSPRAGLNLERPARLPNRSRREAESGSNSMAGPIFLGLVVVVMVFWVVAAFFLPGGETRTSMVSETRADAAPSEQFTSLAGRLSTEPAASTGQGAMAQAAVNTSGPSLPPTAAPAGTGGSLMMAAQSLAPTADSRLEQVGLLPGRTAARSTAKSAPANTEKPVRAAQPAPANRNAAAPSPRSTAPASGQTSPIIPVTPSPPTASGAVARSSVVAAASASSVPRAAAVDSSRSSASGSRAKRQAPDEANLASSREFTVHLASFTDQSNAEQYKSKLNGAGESAFITQAKIDGRMWFRVMSGSFNTRAAAEAHGKDLKRRSLTVETGRYMIKPLD